MIIIKKKKQKKILFLKILLMLFVNKKFKFYLVPFIKQSIKLQTKQKIFNWKKTSDNILDKFSPKFFLALIFALKKKNFLDLEKQRRNQFLKKNNNSRKHFISFLFAKNKGYLIFTGLDHFKIRQKLILNFLNLSQYGKMTMSDSRYFNYSNILLYQQFLSFFDPTCVHISDEILLKTIGEYKNFKHLGLANQRILIDELSFERPFLLSRRLPDFKDLAGESPTQILPKYYFAQQQSTDYDFFSFFVTEYTNLFMMARSVKADASFAPLFFFHYYQLLDTTLGKNERDWRLNMSQFSDYENMRFFLQTDSKVLKDFDDVSQSFLRNNLKWNNFFQLFDLFNTKTLSLLYTKFFDQDYFLFDIEHYLFHDLLNEFWFEYTTFQGEKNSTYMFNFFFFDNDYFFSDYLVGFSKQSGLSHYVFIDSQLHNAQYEAEKFFNLNTFDSLLLQDSTRFEDIIYQDKNFQFNIFDFSGKYRDFLENAYFDQSYSVTGHSPQEFDFLVSWQWKNFLTKQSSLFIHLIPMESSYTFSESLLDNLIIDFKSLGLYKQFSLQKDLLKKWTQKSINWNFQNLYFDPIPFMLHEHVSCPDLFNRTDLDLLLNLWSSLFDNKIRRNLLLTSALTFEDQLTPWLNFLYTTLNFNIESLILKQKVNLVELYDPQQNVFKLFYENNWFNWCLTTKEINSNQNYFFSHPFFNSFHQTLYNFYVQHLVLPMFFVKLNINFWELQSYVSLEKNIKKSLLQDLFLDRIDFYEDFLSTRFLRVTPWSIAELKTYYPQFYCYNGFPRVTKLNYRKFWENSFELYDWHFLHFFDSRWQDSIIPVEYPLISLVDSSQLLLLPTLNYPFNSDKHQFLTDIENSQSKYDLTLSMHLPEYFINQNLDVIPPVCNTKVNDFFQIKLLQLGQNIIPKTLHTNLLPELVKMFYMPGNLSQLNFALNRVIPENIYVENFFMNYSGKKMDYMSWFNKDCELFFFSFLTFFFKTKQINFQSLSDFYLLMRHFDTNIAYPFSCQQLIEKFNIKIYFQDLNNMFLQKPNLSLYEFIEYLLLAFFCEKKRKKEQQLLEILNQLFFFKDILRLCEEPLTEFWSSFFFGLNYAMMLKSKVVEIQNVNYNITIQPLLTFNNFLLLMLSSQERLQLDLLINFPFNQFLISKTQYNKLKIMNQIFLPFYLLHYEIDFFFEIHLLLQLLEKEKCLNFLNAIMINSSFKYRLLLLNKLFLNVQVKNFLRMQSLFALHIFQCEVIFFFFNRYAWLGKIFFFFVFCFSFSFYNFFFFFFLSCLLFFSFRWFYNKLLYNDFLGRFSQILLKLNFDQLCVKTLQDEHYLSYLSLMLAYGRESSASINRHMSRKSLFLLSPEQYVENLLKLEHEMTQLYGSTKFRRYSYNILEQLVVNDVKKQKDFSFYWGLHVKNDFHNRHPLFYISQLSLIYKFWVLWGKKKY